MGITPVEEGIVLQEFVILSENEKSAIYAVESACFEDSWTKEMLFEELESPLCTVCTFLDGGEIAGYALARLAADEAELFRIAVMSGSRRRGAGFELLTTLHKKIKARGAAVCFLEVRSKNAPAVALYKKAGYEQIAVRRGYYGDDDALIMKKTL